MIRVGFVTGLAIEARVLSRSAGAHDPDIDDMIACAGADGARARKAAEALLEAGAGALVSYGIAGGLDPGLEPGDLVLPDAVVAPDGAAVPTDQVWRSRLLGLVADSGLRTAGGRLVGSERALFAVEEKRAVFEAEGAVAVDMESHAVALAARAAGVPLLVLRAVADPATRPLPRAVLGSTAEDGRTRTGIIAARLLTTPWELPGLWHLRRDAAAALGALDRATRALGPALISHEGEP